MHRVLLPVVAPLTAFTLALGFGGKAEPQRIVDHKAARLEREAAIATGQLKARLDAEQAWREAVWRQQVWDDTVARNAYLEALVEAERQAAAARRAATVRRSAPRRSGGGGGCTPEGIVAAESGGRVDAQNPTSTASGKYQFLDSTWDGYGGYARAKDAPESVQDAKFAETWAGGAGAGHWSASVC